MGNDISDRIWLGVVEVNKDPLKLGRIKARVRYLHGDLPIDVLPWIHPRKDNNGNSFNVPRKNKVVNIEYHDSDIASGEYVAAEHYNINLQNMVETLSDDAYTEFVAVYYDHATQLYRDLEKGLVLDHEFSNINLDNDGNINSNLRDNAARVNIGSANAGQSALLGNHVMDWMEEFLDVLMQGGFLGNMGAPTIANPQLIQIITKFKALKDPVFLSKHVFVVDNNKVQAQKRPYKKQLGDGFAENMKVNVPEAQDSPYEPADPTPAEEQEQIDAQEAVFLLDVPAEGVTEGAAEGEEPADAEQFYNIDTIVYGDVIEEVPVYDEAEEDTPETEVVTVTETDPKTGVKRQVKKTVTKPSTRLTVIHPDAKKYLGDLTLDQFYKYLPYVAKATIRQLATQLNATMGKYQINTALRKAHFLAQIAHESISFTRTTEEGDNAGQRYENRANLGNTHPGDGRKYKGRGLIQLTGRNNYISYGRAVGIDLVNNPGLVASDLFLSVDVAGWYWYTKRSNKKGHVNLLFQASDRDDVVEVSRLVNGGKIGLSERKRYTAITKKEMNIA